MSSHGRAKSGDQWPSREIIGAKLLQNAEKGTKPYLKELAVSPFKIKTNHDPKFIPN